MAGLTFPTGKLPNAVLARLLERYGSRDPRVLAGPGIGLDAALIRMNATVLAAKSDPVTFATDRVGWYAVHINANDVACCGAEPRWFLATLLLPETGTTEALVDTILGQIDAACAEVGATLVGGHTEVTHGLDRPLVVGQMLGEAAPEEVVGQNARDGDVLVLTKGVAVEGTAIIARELGARLQGIPEPVVARARGLLDRPGISVVPDARALRRAVTVHAMHDPTEGGLAQAVHELAVASGVGAVLETDRVPVLDECRILCEGLGVDPMRLIASGALLAAVGADDADRALAALGDAGIAATVIGRVVPAAAGVMERLGDGRRVPLAATPRDELARLFEEASNA